MSGDACTDQKRPTTQRPSTMPNTYMRAAFLTLLMETTRPSLFLSPRGRACFEDFELGPRVGLIMHRTQPRHRDVGVQLGGRQAGMAEQLLHDPQVGPTFEQVGGRAVP